jgi:hypothetical protein
VDADFSFPSLNFMFWDIARIWYVVSSPFFSVSSPPVTGDLPMSTQIQSAVSTALEGLKLEFQESKLMGAPSRLSITQATADHIQSLIGKTVVVDSDGSTTIE